MTPDEMEATGELIDMALAAYLAAHPLAIPSKVTALQLIQWVKATAATAQRKGTN